MELFNDKTFLRIDGALESVPIYKKGGKTFYGISRGPAIKDVSSNDVIVPPGYHKSNKYYSGEALTRGGVEWSLVTNPSHVWILNRLDDITQRDFLLSRAIEGIDNSFISKWTTLSVLEKNECITSSGVGVLIRHLTHDEDIQKRTNELLLAEKTHNFVPCSSIEGLDASEYYFNGQIHKKDCWKYDCGESDCECFS
jgi:hypothetical protein